MKTHTLAFVSFSFAALAAIAEPPANPAPYVGPPWKLVVDTTDGKILDFVSPTAHLGVEANRRVYTSATATGQEANLAAITDATPVETLEDHINALTDILLDDTLTKAQKKTQAAELAKKIKDKTKQ